MNNKQPLNESGKQSISSHKGLRTGRTLEDGVIKIRGPLYHKLLAGFGLLLSHSAFVR